MAHFDTKLEAIGKRDLKFMFPKPGTITVASPAVGQYEQMIGVGVFDRTDHLPSIADGSRGKFGGVTACAQVDKAFIAEKIIDAIRDGNAFCVGWKIMVKHRNRLLVPLSSGLMKWSDQLAAFGVNTDHRQAIGGVVLNPGADIAKLLIALAGRRWISQSRLKAFQVSAKGVIHFLKQPAHSVGRNANTDPFELSGNFSSGFASPFAPADRISSGLVFHDFSNRIHDLRRFFSCDGRPAPGARSLPAASVI